MSTLLCILAHNVLRMPWSGLLFLAAQVGTWALLAVHFGKRTSRGEGRTGLCFTVQLWPRRQGSGAGFELGSARPVMFLSLPLAGVVREVGRLLRVHAHACTLSVVC